MAKSARIELRTSPETKEIFSKAAALTGMTVSDFITGHMQSVALKTIERMHLARFSEADIALVKELMNQPKVVNQALETAIIEHQKKYGKVTDSGLRAKPRTREVLKR